MMKKISKSFFLLSLIVCPFVFTSCEKDEGTKDYDNVTDDDWKKSTIIVNDYDGNEVSTDYSICVE